MKKFIISIAAVVLCVCSIFGLVACNNDQTTQGNPPENPAEYGNVLVVYFSATGNTEEVANYIAEYTDGELFELVPVDPYTSADLNYGNDDSRVSSEHDDESLRDIELVASTVENWDE